MRAELLLTCFPPVFRFQSNNQYHVFMSLWFHVWKRTAGLWPRRITASSNLLCPVFSAPRLKLHVGFLIWRLFHEVLLIITHVCLHHRGRNTSPHSSEWEELSLRRVARFGPDSASSFNSRDVPLSTIVSGSDATQLLFLTHKYI